MTFIGERAADATATKANANDGHLASTAMEILRLLPTMDDPSPAYRRLASLSGRLSDNHWLFTDYGTCAAILQNPAFAVAERPTDWVPPDDDFYLSFLQRNGDAHTSLRSVAAAAFAPSTLEPLCDRLSRSAGTLARRFVNSQEFDLVAEYARAIPNLAMEFMFEIGAEHRTTFSEAMNTLASALDGSSDPVSRQQVLEQKRSIEDLFALLLRQRSRGNGADIVTMVANADISNDEKVPLLVLILVSGVETTSALISFSIYGLLNRREQWHECARSYSASERVSDEALRVEAPVQHTLRLCREDTLVGPDVISTGDKVTLVLGAANRDPAVFAEPNTFKPGRDNARRALSFSLGPHYCLGRTLARREAAVAVQQFTRTIAGAEATRAPVRRQGPLIRGFESLWIRPTPAAI